MSSLELRQFLPYRLSLLSNLVSNGISLTYQPRYSLTVTQWRVMAIVNRHSGISAQEIVERSAMDKVAVSRAVRSLRERRLLESAIDQSDRRRASLVLTADGAAVCADIIPAAQRFETELLGALSDEERSTLNQLIRKLTARAQQLSEMHDE